MTQVIAPVRIFVGSSSKARRIMTALCADLANVGNFRVTPWTANVAFPSGGIIIGSLLKAFKNHDFGIFIVSPVYTVQSDKEELLMPADNVILEVGMSIMKYGLERTIMIVHQDTQMPSDLDGVLTLRYSGGIDDVNNWMPGFALQVENAILNQQQQIIQSQDSNVTYWLSLIKCKPGRELEVKGEIFKQITINKRFEVDLLKSGVIDGHYDNFLLFKSSTIEAANFITHIRKELVYLINFIDTKFRVNASQTLLTTRLRVIKRKSGS